MTVKELREKARQVIFDALVNGDVGDHPLEVETALNVLRLPVMDREE